MWYAAEEYGDLILDLEFMTEVATRQLGRLRPCPRGPEQRQLHLSLLEIQIDDASEGIHQTGAVYDAEAPTRLASNGPGEWNRMRITFVGKHITVEINGEKVVDWEAEPRGKVADFAERGYVGLQNHHDPNKVYFRNIRVKEIEPQR